ncbi:putative transcriptional regulator [Mycobacteroides abscessus subsp. abscessus]|uniref:MarR family transcriptional regulator n=1 Tax=Mycobacteroides TaxID=670516 RepID=UPI0009D17156|nr:MULTISPECIES: MarR family transcriptional regulator [Mycobacteroides]SLL30150.1 putative transcriptional regulator [Mycobacteroides abscessus subsp. abscessus]
MSYAQSESVQKLSKTVFGQKNRLAVMAAIAQSEGLVNPTELQVQLRFAAQSSIQDAVRDLVAVGLLSRVDGDGRVFYRRNPHALWTAAIDLLAQALAAEASYDSLS